MEDLRAKLTFRRIVGFLMSLALIGVVVLFQLIVANFSLDAFKNPDFYIRIAYRVALIVLSYHCVINLLYDKMIRSKKVQDAKTKYISAVKLKDISFKKFLEEFNHELKIEAWINKIDKKINKICKKLQNGKVSEKLSNKIEHLESLKTEEYVEKNWAYLNVKWKPLYIGDFSVEDAIGNNSKRTHSQFNVDVVRFSFKKISSYILLSLVLGLIVVNLAFDGVKTVEFWFNMLMDVLLVITRCSDAGFQLPAIIDYNFTDVYLYKVEIMEQYIEWTHKNQLTNSKAHKVLSYIESVEINKEDKG